PRAPPISRAARARARARPDRASRIEARPCRRLGPARPAPRRRRDPPRRGLARAGLARAGLARADPARADPVRAPETRGARAARPRSHGSLRGVMASRHLRTAAGVGLPSLRCAPRSLLAAPLQATLPRRAVVRGRTLLALVDDAALAIPAVHVALAVR